MARIDCRKLVAVLLAMSGLACAVPRRAIAADTVLKSPSLTAAFDAEKGRIAISAREGDQLTPRAEAAFESVARFQTLKSVRSGNRDGIEVRSAAAEPEFTVYLDDRGILEFKPGKARKLVLRGLQLRYAMLPALIGTDFLYDPNALPDKDRLHIPALNMVLGMVEGEGCMVEVIWPSGGQAAALDLKSNGNAKVIDALALDTAGQSFYFSCIQRPGVWHAEPLLRNYLEKNTVIAWKRPFEAQWFGRFYITSDDYDWPFYFINKPLKLWGRYVRDWYNYPVRFDGENTVIHFEKRFRPNGELLVYCLQPHPTHPDASVVTPAEAMARALGRAEADKILDPEGCVEQTLLEHRLAVCAMTNTMQKWFNKGQEVENRQQIARWCDNTSAFIGMIRRRDQTFAAFAHDLKAALADRAQKQPGLSASIAELQKPLAQIEEITQRELPGTSLETVRQWTDKMKQAADEVRPENKKYYGKLAEQCRSVAGTQDDLARTLSVLVIRLTEQAAGLPWNRRNTPRWPKRSSSRPGKCSASRRGGSLRDACSRKRTRGIRFRGNPHMQKHLLFTAILLTCCLAGCRRQSAGPANKPEAAGGTPQETAPGGEAMVYVPAGEFLMGDAAGDEHGPCPQGDRGGVLHRQVPRHAGGLPGKSPASRRRATRVRRTPSSGCGRARPLPSATPDRRPTG